MEQLIQDFNKRFDDTDLRAVRSPLRICPIGAPFGFSRRTSYRYDNKC